MMSWVKYVLVGGTCLGVGAGGTAIVAKHCWSKKAKETNDRVAQLEKDVGEMGAALDNERQLRYDAEAEVLNLSNRLLEEDDKIKNEKEVSNTEQVDYVKLSNKPKPVEKVHRTRRISSEELQDVEPASIIYGSYYKGSGDYVPYGEIDPVEESEWKEEPLRDISNELKEAKVGAILNYKTSDGAIYEIDVVAGRCKGSD